MQAGLDSGRLRDEEPGEGKRVGRGFVAGQKDDRRLVADRLVTQRFAGLLVAGGEQLADEGRALPGRAACAEWR